MVITSRKLLLFNASAMTIWPFILVHPQLSGGLLDRVLRHEWVHWWQQAMFAVIGVGAGLGLGMWMAGPVFLLASVPMGLLGGLLSWYYLYLIGIPFGLPVGWNPMRAYWERKAYLEEGYSNNEISGKLKKKPYYLWWRQ